MGECYQGESEELGKLMAFVYESVPSKKSLMDEIANHPSIECSCPSDSAYWQGFIAALNKRSPHMMVWMVKLSSALGAKVYLVSDLDALRTFLEGEIAKVRNPEKQQSPKVLAKMLAIRLSRALEDSRKKAFFLTEQEINLQRNLEWCNNNPQSSDEK